MSEKLGTLFDQEEFKPYQRAWNARLRELTTRASYYDGAVYRSLKNTAVWTMGPRVGKEIKGLFLPLSRAVDIDAGIIGGDWLFPEDDAKAEAWDAARDVLFDRSHWDTDGVLYVHYGAQYGVSGLRIADVWEGEKRVLMQPADPTRFMLVYNSPYSMASDMAIWIEQRDGEDGQYEYAEVITPERIRTFKDGSPFGYFGASPEYTNKQGVVPIVEVVHIKDGTELGECTYQKSIPMLNEVNEMATRLSDIITKNTDPQWTIAGAEPSDLKRGSDIMWFLPEGAETKPVVPIIDIPGVLEFIREIKEGVKESPPELSYDELIIATGTTVRAAACCEIWSTMKRAVIGVPS